MEKYLTKIRKRYTPQWSAAILAALALVGGTTAYAVSSGQTDASPAASSGASSVGNLVGIVGSDFSSTTPGTSWPAELVASDLSQVQPQRQGVVADWNVRVGQWVSKGQVLGHLTAPPNTPELVGMLADRKESLARTQAEAQLADTYTQKEQSRLSALSDSIDSPSQNADSTYTALLQLRQEEQTKQASLRALIERVLSGHVAVVTNFSDWRFVRSGGLNRHYGLYDPSLQNSFESELIALSATLQKSTDVPLDEAQKYLALAVRLANLSGAGDTVAPFKAQAASDQKEFLDMLADYRAAQSAVSDKATEYKLDIAQRGAELEKDRGVAHAAAQAAQVSYDTVLQQVSGSQSIVAPRSGTISAIYKKTGDLVNPDVVLAIVSGDSSSGLIVRMHIPNNIKQPAAGDTLAIVRPGFPTDVRKAKLVGIGSIVDESGTYMADAVLSSAGDWPAGTSVRVLAPSGTATVAIPSSALWWSDTGSPMVWRVSDAGRIYSSKITVGRTIGSMLEVYSGLKNGDRYMKRNSADMREDMMLDELTGLQTQDMEGSADQSKKSGGMGAMPGMDM